MPAGFENCRKKGGKIRTVSGPNKQLGLRAGEYMRVCILDGKVHRGEVRTKKSSS